MALIPENYIPFGDCGDCGNWAVAFQAVFGGQLIGIFEVNQARCNILQHVVVEIGEDIYDSHGVRTLWQVFDEWIIDDCDVADIFPDTISVETIKESTIVLDPTKIEYWKRFLELNGGMYL